MTAPVRIIQRHVIVTGPSPFDRYTTGDASTMDQAAVRGMTLFKGKGGCVACHNGPNFTDSEFYNIGLKHNPILDSDGSYVAKTIIHGRSGTLSVHDKVFNAIMPPVGTQQGLSDAEIAAVASHVRSAWGNQATAVTEEIVKQRR